MNQNSIPNLAPHTGLDPSKFIKRPYAYLSRWVLGHDALS